MGIKEFDAFNIQKGRYAGIEACINSITEKGEK